MKYKRSINCKKPKGFSQKQYCKYGRKKGGGTINDNQLVLPEDHTSWDDVFFFDFIENSDHVESLRTIATLKNKIDENENLIGTSEVGYMALKKYNLLTNHQHDIESSWEQTADSLIPHDFFLGLIKESNDIQTLMTIIKLENTIENQNLIGTSKVGYIALKKYNQITNYEDDIVHRWERDADDIISESSPYDDTYVKGVMYFDENNNRLGALDFHEQFII
tara:strand:- start:876 stop:1538 length:663 start_codon:yes stop_codon:yes gene_type:complete